jgi:hypothetical protein
LSRNECGRLREKNAGDGEVDLSGNEARWTRKQYASNGDVAGGDHPGDKARRLIEY